MVEAALSEDEEIPIIMPEKKNTYNLSGVVVNMYKTHKDDLPCEAEHSQIHKYSADLLSDVLLKF
jgi:hypothetical protein